MRVTLVVDIIVGWLTDWLLSRQTHEQHNGRINQSDEQSRPMISCVCV